MSVAYLLDTYALIWAQTAPNKLNPKVRKIIYDALNRVVVSVASVWEMAIKVKLGKLTPMPSNYLALLRE